MASLPFCWTAETCMGLPGGAHKGGRYRRLPTMAGQLLAGGPPWGPPTEAGMASRRGAAGQTFRNPSIERAVDRGQVSPGDVEIPGGRIDGAVAEQELDGGRSTPAFQQRWGTTRPEGMGALCRG